jgi:hypothetical protein
MSSFRRLAWKLAAGVAAPAAMCVLCGLAWDKHGEAMVASPEYAITAERIKTPSQPAWIHADVKAEAIRDGALDELSTLDREAALKIERAFAMHTWVARVKRVRKRYPARIDVDLEYRRPAAMVEVVGGLYPVDRFGVLLPPANFAEVQVRDYLRASVGSSSPAGPVGTPWGDELVADAAAMASVCDAHWKGLGLYRIRAIDAEKARAAKQPACFALETKSGARVKWGRAPGKEAVGEPKAAAKIARLLAHAKQQGPLTSLAAGELLDLSIAVNASKNVQSVSHKGALEPRKP